MGAQHTPGPWTHWENSDDIAPPPSGGGLTEAPFGVIAEQSSLSIADMWFGADGGCHISREEAEANARLMAAAPELLAQLQGLLAAAQIIVSAVDIDPDTTNIDFRANGDSVAKVMLSTLLASAGAAIAKATEA